MRLIDADALLDALDKSAIYGWSLQEDAAARRWAERVVELMPTAEPERKKGEWIPMQVSSGRDSWKCSVCGRRARGKKENLPFCHCGADMRSEVTSD